MNVFEYFFNVWTLRTCQSYNSGLGSSLMKSLGLAQPVRLILNRLQNLNTRLTDDNGFFFHFNSLIRPSLLDMQWTIKKYSFDDSHLLSNGKIRYQLTF